MITYSQLGRRGRLGNMLFEIASIIGLANRYKHDWIIPFWRYSEFFKNSFNQGFINTDIIIREKKFHYQDFHALEDFANNESIDMLGYFQSEKYWDDNKGLIKEQFEFKPEFVKKIKGRLNLFDKETICIHIRRGDYVDNPNYMVLPIEYYIHALYDKFPNWEQMNVLVFSDDYDYCKLHFEALSNVYLAEGFNDIESLCLMAQCEHFILSNSTFSWWAAYLGEKDGSIVVRPDCYFNGELLFKNDTRDFWMPHWAEFSDYKKKVDLTDVTFVIPVKYDHLDRLENSVVSLDFLTKYFDTNVIMMEQGGSMFESLRRKYPKLMYAESGVPIFHRTKMINDMVKLSQSDIIFNWDCDVLIPPFQILETVNRLRDGSFDFVMPYDGRFSGVSRQNIPTLMKHKDLGIIASIEHRGNHDSFGGAVAFNKDKFIESGMENEKFLSYAPEDKERFWRFNKLGYKVGRVLGRLYHLDHFRGEDSSDKHVLYEGNEREINKEIGMSKDQLKEYVKTWNWL